LIPHLTIAELRNVELEANGGSSQFSYGRIPIIDGRSIGLLDIDNMVPRTKNKGDPPFGIFFDKGLPIENEPIIPTLV
jgi:hypothetical protein